MMRLLSWLVLQRPEARTPIVFMPLADAYVCNDWQCSTVSNCARFCPICYCSVHPVAAFIDREVEAK